MIDRALALQSGSTSVQTPAPAALPNTFGAQSTLVILVNFQDNPTQPYTVDYGRNVVFTTTSNFDLENSYGQPWLTGDVADWYTIPVSSPVCDFSSVAGGGSARRPDRRPGVLGADPQGGRVASWCRGM
jgi:hypothetical protein